MKTVFIYVEGPSDKAAMERLFAKLIAEKMIVGVAIAFHFFREGNGKKNVVLHAPRKAADIVSNTPDSYVVAMPDLYPPNIGFDHSSPQELQDGMLSRFKQRCDSIAPKKWTEFRARFKVFCFKHDLEVLLLASPGALASRLGVSNLAPNWARHPEDQNHDVPPKRVVENVFREHGEKYDTVADAPLILANCDYRALAEACPQCFKPFVEFLENL